MIGKTISHYRILEKLGEGGMGVVFKAEDTKLGRLVALKFLPKGLEADEAERARFIQEAKAASALNHPNVCIIYDLHEHEDEQFIVMEYVDGVTLREKIREGLKEGESTGRGAGSPMPMKDALSYAIQIGEALQEAHSKGIVHRDIKSDNIMVMAKGQVKVMDFGLAKLKGALRLTKSTSTVGTLAYMAPEQLQGKETDARMDIFSFGVALYEMLTGHMPFKGEYESAIMYSILNTEPEPLSDVPADIDSIVYKALAKNPDERYQNTEDMLKELRKAQKEVEFMSSRERTADERPKPSIAVLPFVNMSADPEQEYFCDGIAEEIINALTHIERLRVIARTSAFSFKGKDIDISEIGKKLKVENILEGSVRKSGSRLRITAQLINVSDSSHLWSERYDREMQDVFDIQDEISLAIVDNLKVKLLGKEKEAVVKRYTENLEAYNLYLKGNYYWQMMTREGYDKAIECYELALKKDPHYAFAYTGLSMVHWASSYWGNVPPNEAYPKVKEYAEKALEIDDTLAEAHAFLGAIYMNYDWNWKAAEQKFNQALQLNPNSALIHSLYSLLLTFTGRHKEAITEAKRAQNLDPLSIYINTRVSFAFIWDSQYDRAIEELQMTIAMNPNYFYSHYFLGVAYFSKSMFEEAITEYEKAIELSGGAPHLMTVLELAYYESGEVDKAEKIFDSLKQRSKDEYVRPTCFYLIHKVRGDQDQAFEWIERACNEHDSFLPLYRVSPLDKIRIPDEPRYTELLKKYGIGK